ncbi:DUF3519 domain-containing protein [Helicobacter pylori]|uniref:DUF3519 domain-containing protein n=1 Tax=Helicobacter pylori TaxID=210 RepID=UPI0019225917|nr:DUF3519 domain-containing protein [Helicobacter pylori]
MKLPKALNEATAGAALKYHIKRALERSHTISDFSKNLELSAKNSQFTNNTLKIIEELNNAVKQASDELIKKASDLEHALTPLKEFGTNYPEFALKPKEALEKLLQEKNGQVAGAAYRDDLGGIDFVWGNKDYGLAHILEKREKQYQKLGLTTEQAKERTNELLKEIPNILQKGFKEEDRSGYAAIILNNSKVILSKFKGDNELKNHYMITSYEVDDKVLRELETIAPLSNDYRDGGSISNLNEPNLIQNPLTSQENLLKTQESALKTQDLSPLELANAEKLAKLESDRIESEKEFKRLKEQERKAALKYHIKRALERSHTISDFTKQLDLSAKNSQFSNNTLKIIEELNNGVKQAREELKEATKPSNLVKSIREQDTCPFEVIEDKEAFFKDLNQNLNDNAILLPKGMSVKEFKQTLESVENKDRFLEHLQTRENSEERLAAFNLVEPTIREPHIEIFTKDKNSATEKKEYIKAFKDENQARLYMLITQDNDTILRTFIPDIPERYVRKHVRNADIIHSFIQPNRTAKSDEALSPVVVYGENTTKNPLTSQENLLKTQESALKTQDLSPLELAKAEKLAKLESEKLESEKEFLTSHQIFLKEAKGNATNFKLIRPKALKR